MKKLLLSLFALSLGGQFSAFADEVAILNIRMPGEKATKPVVLEFYESDATQSVENFKKLAKKGFFNGLSFHRAFAHTLLQSGDPLSSSRDNSRIGTGGPGYTLPPKFTANTPREPSRCPGYRIRSIPAGAPAAASSISA